MAKETSSHFPPGGAVSLWAYDSVGDKWYAVLADGDGYLKVKVATSGLPEGAATAAKQLPDGHNVTVDNESIAVTGAFYPETQPISEASPGARIVQLYGWDGDSWEKVPVAGSLNEPLLVRVGSGTNLAQVGNVGGDDIGTTTKVMFVGAFLYGFDGINWDRLRCNASKQLEVEIKAATTLTVQSTGGDKIFAFESIVEEALADADLSEGDNALTGTAVPSGKVWKITRWCAMYEGTLPSRFYITAFGVATAMIISDVVPDASDRWIAGHCDIYMQVDDYIRLDINGATVGDGAYLRYSGVQMDTP